MNELIINNNESKGLKLIASIVGIYASLLSAYQLVMCLMNKTLDVNFYLSLALLVLSVILVLSSTVWGSKPNLIINSESVYVKMAAQKTVYKSEWVNIRELAIGLSYLKMLETDGKTYTVDISDFKYNDLKNIKSQVIEICESKSIPYKND